MQSIIDQVVKYWLSRLDSHFETVWVAYSGGVDSQVLLHAMARLIPEAASHLRLKAIHVNHGLSTKAGDWAKHCQQTCQQLSVPLTLGTVTVDCPAKTSVEAQARQARYRYFAEQVTAGGVLVTAHHQQDQAETLLIQLLRGAGPKGLAAMPEQTSFAGNASLARPLLEISKAHILNYAQTHALAWCDDESNFESRFTRNFLRQHIFPLLTDRWPSVAATLGRSARLCAEADELLTDYAQELVARCQTNANSLGQYPYLLISCLIQLPLRQQKLVLRQWLTEQGFALPSEVKLLTVLDNVCHAKPDRHPEVTWADVRAIRSGDQLVIEFISE